MFRKKNKARIDGNNNIVIQDVSGSTITINQGDPKLEEKLKQLPEDATSKKPATYCYRA